MQRRCTWRCGAMGGWTRTWGSVIDATIAVPAYTLAMAGLTSLPEDYMLQLRARGPADNPHHRLGSSARLHEENVTGKHTKERMCCILQAMPMLCLLLLAKHAHNAHFAGHSMFNCSLTPVSC